MTLSREELLQFAHDLGFSMMAVAPARPSPHLEAYLKWIRAGMHGTMSYMARPDRVDRRRDLNIIMPEARSLIIVALDYAGLAASGGDSDPMRGRIATYAWGPDYHEVMLPRLEHLAAHIKAASGAPIEYRAYVDTGAILERSHAQQAGLGFVGKNTMLIHPRRGSYFFLGEIITSLDLPADPAPEMPGCGTCERCLSACPTDAFPQPYVLDARRCISYLTIEHKGWIEPQFRSLMGNWVFGCDVCQEVCPWQRFADVRSLDQTIDNKFRPELSALLRLNEEVFSDLYVHTPLQRTGRDRLVRNACIAAGNSRSILLAPDLIRLLDDPSSLVRGHAAWALAQIRTQKEPLQLRLGRETDPEVRGELQSALEQLSQP